MPKSKGVKASDLNNIAQQKNRFACPELDSSSDSEYDLSSGEEEEVPVKEEEPSVKSPVAEMRKWTNPESESHVNIFNSPFYKGKRTMIYKQNTRPRFVDDGDNDSGEVLTGAVVYEERAPIVREEPKTPTGDTIIFPPEEDTTTASMWAEKVKECLEKAEASRAKKDDFHESLNRLSFFRRPMSK
jgi:hypothetical protein